MKLKFFSSVFNFDFEVTSFGLVRLNACFVDDDFLLHTFDFTFESDSGLGGLVGFFGGFDFSFFGGATGSTSTVGLIFDSGNSRIIFLDEWNGA